MLGITDEMRMKKAEADSTEALALARKVALQQQELTAMIQQVMARKKPGPKPKIHAGRRDG